MKLSNVAVLGGGPGGLYAARLLKRSHPSAHVTVYEQSDPDTTFGFGVGIAAATQRRLREADPESLDAITAAAFRSDGATMAIDGAVAHLPDSSGLGIARNILLSTLRTLAEDSGVRLVYGAHRSAFDLDAELIVAADGVNSATRRQLAAELGETITTGRDLYLWCGTDFALSTSLFSPVTTKHGTFVTHAYPYGSDRSTFLIETDERTWRRAGFDTTTRDTPPSESDQVSLDYLEAAFRTPLQGHHLIGNRTRWTKFRTVSCSSWHHDNIVLLGDAVHTAHYSIGSGTKLAMEDAIALDHGIKTEDTLDAAFASYEAARMPAVRSLQAAAARSQNWWTAFPDRFHLPVDTIMASYMTRTGRVSLDRLTNEAPEVASSAIRALLNEMTVGSTDVTVETILDVPFMTPEQDLSGRVVTRADVASHSIIDVDVDMSDVWSDDADTLLGDLVTHDLVADIFWLTGLPGREALLNRLEFAERVMLNYPKATVVTEASEELAADLAVGVMSHRTHLVAYA